MQTAYAAWYTAYAATVGPHTEVDTEAKNDAKKAAVAAIRPFVNQYLRFPPVTNEDRTAMGIPNRKPRSPIKAPTSHPEGELRFPGIHLVEIANLHKAADSGDDPRADYGVSIHVGILNPADPESKYRIDKVPVKGSDIPYAVFTRKKNCSFNLDGESGKDVYFCLQYENAKGGEAGRGPFGPIMHAVIP
jgi:hypothetical protein